MLVIGVGKAETADAMSVERWAGHAVRRTLTSGAEKLVLQPDALPGVSKADSGAHAAMGARLAAYRFDTYKVFPVCRRQPYTRIVIVTRRSFTAKRSRWPERARARRLNRFHQVRYECRIRRPYHRDGHSR